MFRIIKNVLQKIFRDIEVNLVLCSPPSDPTPECVVQNIRLFGIGYGIFHYNLKLYEVLKGLYLLIVHGLCKFRDVLGGLGSLRSRYDRGMVTNWSDFVLFGGLPRPGITPEWSKIVLFPCFFRALGSLRSRYDREMVTNWSDFVMFGEVWGRYAPDMTAEWSQIGLKPS